MMFSTAKWIIVVLGMWTLFGCTARDRMLFGDGLAAVTGKGGEVARADAMPSTRSLARELGPEQPRPVWMSPFPQEGADFAVFINDSRVLVGAVESGAALGVPDFKEIILYDTTTGAEMWRSKRPEIRNGFYSVLATGPVIVLEGRGGGTGHWLGYDPQTGVNIWKHSSKKPYRAMVHDRFLFTTAFRKNTWSVEKIKLQDGSRIWAKKIKTGTRDDRPFKIDIQDGHLFLVSQEIHALNLDDGSSQWSGKAPWQPFMTLDFYRRPDGYLAAGLKGLALFDAKTGAVKWSHESGDIPIRMATLAGDRIYLLRGTGPLLGGSAAGDFFVECIDLRLRPGRRGWRYPLPSRVVGPIVHHGKLLVFTTKDRLIALNANTGKKVFQRTLPADLVAASPSAARYKGTPDLITIHGRKLILARELYGVAAFSLKNGRLLWQQPHYLTTLENPYTVNQQINVLQQTLKMYGYLAGNDNPTAVVNSFDTQQRESAVLQSMQRSADDAIARADRELANRNTTRLGREAAHSSKITAIESNIIAERMAQHREALQATWDLMYSMIDLVEAFGEALKQHAQQGLFERLAMKMRASMMARAQAIEGDFYIWPFQERGRGLTLVDLRTGRRNDLIFAPMVLPLQDYGVDLPTYALSPGKNRLVTFGVSLDESRYEEYVKWKWRIPRASTLAYTIKQFKFAKKSATAKYWEKNLKTDLVEWAYRGDVGKVRELIAKGVDVNQEKYTITPLWAAIFRGHEDVVKVLIDNGANVNWEHTMMNFKPLEMAENVKASEKIKEMLKTAGARK